MIHSLEAAVLHAVIEDREEHAAELLHHNFLDGELKDLLSTVSTLLDLINAETDARGMK